MVSFFKKKGAEKATPITEPKKTITGQPLTYEHTLPKEEDLKQAQEFGESRKQLHEEQEESTQETTKDEIDEEIDDILEKHYTTNEQLHQLQKLRTKHKSTMKPDASQLLDEQISVHREAINHLI